MPSLELSSDEYVVLHGVIAARLAEIQHEVHHTDNREFRAFLLRRQDLLVRLLARMEQGAHAAVGA